MEAVEQRLATDPAYRAWYEQTRLQAQQAVENYRNNPSAQRTYQTTLTGIVTIPLVVHIVLPNPEIVTDADVQYFVDRLNLDFSGLNPDSTNGALFYGVRGHSLIRFCLARRTPTGTLTNGIERRSGNVQIGFGEPQAIKSFSNGGLDPWNTSQYYNVWVGAASGGLLGIAPTIGPGTAANDGVCIAYEVFANNPCYTLPNFNLGRTGVHEIGHNFGLYHTFTGGCNATNDFAQLLSPGCTLPANLLDPADDVPAQSSATAGCPSGAVAAGCAASPNPPGKMYQNYMDYTDDQCYSMFSKGNVDRMHWVLENCRAGYLTSLGCVPPAGAVTLDAAATVMVNPGGSELNGCLSTTYGAVVCPGPVTNPKVRITNTGLDPITSLSVRALFNTVVIGTQNLTGLNIPSGGSIVVTFPGVINFIGGVNTLTFEILSVNGGADGVPANNILSQTFNLSGGGAPLPFVEGFEGTTFPPTGWLRINPDNGITWQRTTTGVAHTGVAKAFVDHFNYTAAGATDDLRTPNFAIGTADSLWVSFWGAYRGFPGFPFDQFQVMVSTNCGQTFTTVYNARNDTAFVGPEGASPTTGAGYYPSSVDQWVRKSINLSNFISAGSLQVQFRAINQFGNNMHLDDINIDKKIFPNNDAGVVAINKPDAKVCTNSQAPVVVIKNYGKINLTRVRINYQIDGTGPITTLNWTGNLARNQVETVTLATANLGAVGNHSIKVYTSLPNDVADEDLTNDTLVKSYSVSQIIPLPGTVTEDFSSATFPPTNWQIINPNGDITWTRNALVGNRVAGSAYFNDYVNTNLDRIDDLAMPNYSYSGIDSIFLSFNLAHLTRTLPGTTGSRLDTLTVLLSRDCGNTFTTVYKKYGEDLQTVNDPNFQTSMLPFVPKANEWRRDSLNLGQWLGSTEPLFQIIYRFSGNIENNFYLDDISMRTQILPQKLKNQGYLILPNPFRQSFGVWHYQVPTTLRYVNVYNSVGQLVYSKQFPGGGEKYFQIDLGGRAAGTYTVNLGYEDSNRNVNVQIVKY